MPRELNSAEVEVFRAAHPEIQYSQIPQHGTAFKDGSRYVLVWLDAIWRWRYIDLTGATQFDELTKNKPAFVSPDGGLIENLWRQLNVVGNVAETALKVVSIAAVVLVVLFLIVEFKQATA